MVAGWWYLFLNRDDAHLAFIGVLFFLGASGADKSPLISHYRKFSIPGPGDPDGTEAGHSVASVGSALAVAIRSSVAIKEDRSQEADLFIFRWAKVSS